MAELNQCSDMQLTYEFSDWKAIVLDFHVFKGTWFATSRKLDFKPYFKLTNRFLSLLARSNHPKHMQLSIVRGEAIRCVRNSSRKLLWLEAMHKTFKGLIARGFDGKDIQDQWSIV